MGCLFLGIGAASIYYADIRIQSMTLAQATIIDMREVESTDSDNNTSYSSCPTVRYTANTGEIVQVVLRECDARPAYNIGDRVEIYYNPADTTEVQVKGGTGWSNTNFAGIGFRIAGGLICIGSLGWMAAIVFVIIRRPWPALPTPPKVRPR
jgi:hypothetical protein